MRITIHRGTHQIGGCITEYEYEGWRLFVDYGEQLPGTPVSDKPLEIEGLTTGDLSKSALLITHYHGDHIGKISELDFALPIYMGEVSREIAAKFSGYLKTVSEASAKLLERLSGVRTFVPGVAFGFGPFSIMPITVDHSAFDAYAFKIEVDGVSVFHTGDFRTSGFRSGKFKKLINTMVGRVDYVVCEATNVRRQEAVTMSEHELQQKFKATFRENKYNIVYLSSTNIDRLFALYHAAAEIGRKFIVDAYQKEIMDVITERDNLWGKSRLFRYHKDEYAQPMVMMTEGSEFHVNDKFKSLLQDKGYVLIARANPRFDRLIAKLPGEKKRYLSMWNGYLRPDSPAFNHTLADLIGDNYDYLHTSGHCDMSSLKGLMEILKPKAIIPIHTNDGEAFAKLFSDKWPVELLKDGESFAPISAEYSDSVSARLFAVMPPREGLSEVANEGNCRWWSLDKRHIGCFSTPNDAMQAFRKASYAPNRVLGYDIEDEEDMYPSQEDIYDSDFNLISGYAWGGHLPGELKFGELGWLKPGDKVLAIICDVFNIVVPCVVVGPITEEFLETSVEADDSCPLSYDEVKGDMVDWDWDCVVVRPLVRVKDDTDVLPETVAVQRIYCFPYREFEI